MKMKIDRPRELKHPNRAARRGKILVRAAAMANEQAARTSRRAEAKSAVESIIPPMVPAPKRHPPSLVNRECRSGD